MRPELLKLFINKGAFADAVDKYGFPPIYYSAKRYPLNLKAKLIFEVLLLILRNLLRPKSRF
jgi:hypothetical protein